MYLRVLSPEVVTVIGGRISAAGGTSTRMLMP